jgi:guanine deaminase
MNTEFTLFKAQILHFPSETETPSSNFQFEAEGALVVEGKKIKAVGDYATLRQRFPYATEHDYAQYLLIPGLIDSHLHFPQIEMIASYGEQLMAWLENYTFPTEIKFADPEYCSMMAEVFLQQLFKNGTTTALAYATVHAHSADALFAAASAKNMALITGKICMDSAADCPDELRDSVKSSVDESQALIQKWHNKGRNQYAITPRFVPTSTPEQLAALGELARAYPDVFIQTHLSENQSEVALVAERFPQHNSYLDVYDHYGLVREKAVFGHCVHLPESSWLTLREKGATAAFCPSSNLFLGSGLFDYASAQTHKVQTVLASDIGAGTSLNMLRTYGEAYKVCQLQQHPIDALTGLYMMTQGAAVAHQLANDIGNLNPGSFADFVILNPNFDTLTALRGTHSKHISDSLFSLSILGDDRAVVDTFVAGQSMLNSTSQEKRYAMA